VVPIDEHNPNFMLDQASVVVLFIDASRKNKLGLYQQKTLVNMNDINQTPKETSSADDEYLDHFTGWLRAECEIRRSEGYHVGARRNIVYTSEVRLIR